MKPSKITHSKYFIPVTLFLLCFLLYGNTLWNSYAEDDVIYTQNEFIIKGFSAFKDILDKGSLYGWKETARMQQYRPLTLLNIMAEISIFGLNPHISHFFNVLFFALTVVVLYFFLQRILRNYKQSIIIAATLLFAFHPIHTEVVANIKSRDEILAFLFGLIAFYFIMLQQEQRWQGRFLNRPYIFSLLAFFASLFCKENALTFVAIIPLLLFFFTDMKLKKILLKTIPYIILIGIYLLIRIHVLQTNTFSQPIPISDNALMSTNSNADRMATGFVLLGKYIYMTIIPYPLSWDYSYNQIPIVTWGNIKPVSAVLVFAGLISFALWGIKSKSIYSFLILFFFITLSLSCNLIIKIAGTFAERFLYVPSLAFCIALPILVVNTIKNKRLELITISTTKVLSIKLLVLISFVCILIVYTLIAIPRNAIWKNDYTLYSSGVITSPGSEKTHADLAFTYFDTARNSQSQNMSLQFYTLSAHEFEKTIKIESYMIDTDIYEKLGFCFFNLGNYDSAIYAFNKVLEVKHNYSFALTALSKIHNNIGLNYFRNNELDCASREFSIALKIDSNLIEAIENIALVYEKEGKEDMAKKYIQMAAQKKQGL